MVKERIEEVGEGYGFCMMIPDSFNVVDYMHEFP